MFPTRIKLMGTAVVAVVLTASGAGLYAQREAGRDGADVHGVVRSVNAAQNTITIAGSLQRRDEAPTPDRTFTLAKDAEVLLDDGRLGRSIAPEGKLADISPGAIVSLRLSADKKTVEAVLAEGPSVRGKLSGADATKRTLTVAEESRGRGEEAPAEKTYSVGKHAEVTINDGSGRRFAPRLGSLADLPAGCIVMVKLSPNQKEAVAVMAEGPTLRGTIKAVDGAKKSITLTLGAARGAEAAEERTYTVASGGDILMENERPRRFFPLREAQLGDLPVGAVATLKLSLDQNTAMHVLVEGPTIAGVLKALDPGKGTVNVLIGRSRESDGEEKSYTVAKDVRVWADGAESKLADLKVADPPQTVMLKLSLDQKAVRTMQVGSGRGSR
jgi:hypothetical protein